MTYEGLVLYCMKLDWNIRMDGGLCTGDNYFLLTNLLSEDERKVITSITAHIERGEKRAGIQQIAAENYLSTASIIKMCKRLGFDGYS